ADRRRRGAAARRGGRCGGGTRRAGAAVHALRGAQGTRYHPAGRGTPAGTAGPARPDPAAAGRPAGRHRRVSNSARCPAVSVRRVPVRRSVSVSSQAASWLLRQFLVPPDGLRYVSSTNVSGGAVIRPWTATSWFCAATSQPPPV